MRSGRMPSRIHQTAKCDSPAKARDENGGPLSVRMASGQAELLEGSLFEDGLHLLEWVCCRSDSQRRRYRLNPSEMVSG